MMPSGAGSASLTDFVSGPPSMSGRTLSRNLSRNSTVTKDNGPKASMGGRSKSKKVFRCPMENCGRVFDRKYNMQIHIRKHTGEMPYQCKVEGCGARFKWRSSLVNHNRKHESGELPGDPDPTLPTTTKEPVREGDPGTLFPPIHPTLARHATDPSALATIETNRPFQFDFLPSELLQSSPTNVGDLIIGNNRPNTERPRTTEPVYNCNTQNAHHLPPYPPRPCPPQQPTAHFYEDSQSFDLSTGGGVAENNVQGTTFELQVDQVFFDSQHEDNFFSSGGARTFVPAPEATVDTDFIERFNGALTCDYDSFVVEEAIENPFTSPVSDIFHVNDHTSRVKPSTDHT